MRNLKTFRIFESSGLEQKGLVEMCEELLTGFPIWEETKEKLISENPDLEIVENPYISANAQFDSFSSTEAKIVILITPKQREDNEYKGTLAHELVHMLQFVRDGELDLFTTDITREFEVFSDDEQWQRLLMAIYLTDPIEVEAKRAELRWHKDPMTQEMIGWMGSFDPRSFAKYLSSLTPLPNEFDLENFNELPDLWFSVYVNYVNGGESGQPISSEIKELEGASLEEFLRFYDRRFKQYKQKLVL